MHTGCHLGAAVQKLPHWQPGTEETSPGCSGLSGLVLAGRFCAVFLHGFGRATGLWELVWLHSAVIVIMIVHCGCAVSVLAVSAGMVAAATVLPALTFFMLSTVLVTVLRGLTKGCAMSVALTSALATASVSEALAETLASTLTMSSLAVSLSVTVSARCVLFFCQHDISSIKSDIAAAKQRLNGSAPGFCQDAAKCRGGDVHAGCGFLLRQVFRIHKPHCFQHVQADDGVFGLFPAAIFPLRDFCAKAGAVRNIGYGAGLVSSEHDNLLCVC